SVHRRRYRIGQGEAPLKETLGAAMLMRAGWPHRDRDLNVLYDPMCGAGTLLIEGLLMALDIAPGLVRDSRLTAWPQHDAAAMTAVLEEGRQRRQASADWRGRAAGSDVDPRVIEF